MRTQTAAGGRQRKCDTMQAANSDYVHPEKRKLAITIIEEHFGDLVAVSSPRALLSHWPPRSALLLFGPPLGGSSLLNGPQPPTPA